MPHSSESFKANLEHFEAPNADNDTLFNKEDHGILYRTRIKKPC